MGFSCGGVSTNFGNWGNGCFFFGIEMIKIKYMNGHEIKKFWDDSS
jgi:hypothetical protein